MSFVGKTRGHPRRGGAALLAALVAPLCVVSCGGGDVSDLESWVVEVKGRQKGRIEPLPEIRVTEPYLYDASQLRDPFLRAEPRPEPSVAAQGGGIGPDAHRRREELESYSLDTLRLVGTLMQDDVMWGVVSASGGTLHRVREGNYIGQNHGRIQRVSEQRIELVEIVPDGLGGWRERQASLALVE